MTPRVRATHTRRLSFLALFYLVTLSLYLFLKLTLVMVFIAPVTALHLRHFHVRLSVFPFAVDTDEESDIS